MNTPYVWRWGGIISLRKQCGDFFWRWGCSQCLEVGTAEVFGRCGIFAASTTLTTAPAPRPSSQNYSKIAQRPHSNYHLFHFCTKLIFWLHSKFGLQRFLSAKNVHFKKTWCQIQSSADLKVSAFGKQDLTSQISGKPILSVIQGGWLLFEYFATWLKLENRRLHV